MDERKVSKARMSLVTSRCPRIRAPKLEHAAWQNGARPPLSHRTQPPRVLTPRKIDGTRLSDRRWVSAGLSQGPAYKSRPGLFTRQGQIGVPGSGRLGPWDSKTSSSREVSRDRQRLRRFLSCLPASKPDFSTPSSRFLSLQNHHWLFFFLLSSKPDCSTPSSQFFPPCLFGACPFTKPTNSSP